MNRSRVLPGIAFAAVAVLLIAGLAWATRVALQLEHADTVRLALWRLDSRIFPILAREDSRPVSHYEPLYPPTPALTRTGTSINLGNVLLPSPLLSVDLPDWVSLHFVIDAKLGWRSPQVPNETLAKRLRDSSAGIAMTNATPERAARLQHLALQFPVRKWFDVDETIPQVEASAQQNVANDSPTQVSQGRFPNSQQAGQWLENEARVRSQTQTAIRGDNRSPDRGNTAVINYAPLPDLVAAKDMSLGQSYVCSKATIDDLKPVWRNSADGTEHLLLLRRVDGGELVLMQGVLLDWPRLREVLTDGVRDLLPDAQLVRDEGQHPDRMSALPVRLDAGDAPMTLFPLNTPLRWGLTFAWSASAIALVLAALGGWSLLDLSERRFRFVSAVTHELRTPLTTLRLYLDMLTSGLVRDEAKKTEYLNTLHGEADRLHRLIANVLEFARLERQMPVVNSQPVVVRDFMESMKKEWGTTCHAAGKSLDVSIEDGVPDIIETDSEILRQLLGNLIDNSCKYSREAEDPTVRLSVGRTGDDFVFAVEDRGPGIATRDIRAVFRPFRRGTNTPAASGGVGLGLTLANRWSKLLGGDLRLKDVTTGARFEFALPNAPCP
ncbi:MAG: HAMP domain-containing histidine kinase [Gemmataceae bacterium]|nr:HAMP domain-containing histidine kinase [Gemmataceae bacterium]